MKRYCYFLLTLFFFSLSVNTGSTQVLLLSMDTSTHYLPDVQKRILLQSMVEKEKKKYQDEVKKAGERPIQTKIDLNLGISCTVNIGNKSLEVNKFDELLIVEGVLVFTHIAEYDTSTLQALLVLNDGHISVSYMELLQIIPDITKKGPSLYLYLEKNKVLGIVLYE